MNPSQIHQVKGYLEVLSALDLGEIVASKYGDDVDLSGAPIAEYSVKEYVSSARKVFAQFREEIDGAYAKAMPFEYNFQNEYGHGNLRQDLEGLLNQIKSKNLRASIPHLNRLIHYQAINGFWEKSKRKYFRPSEINAQEDKDRVELDSKHVNEVSKRLSGLISQINDEKVELGRFTKSKESELSEIASLLEAARLHVSEISEIHTKSSTLKERITFLLEQAEEKKILVDELTAEIKSLLSTASKVLKETNKENELHKEEYQKLVDVFTDRLSFVESKKEYFEERNQYLNDLIGREVGASLFETFKHRKNELVTSIFWWKLAVPGTAIITIAWIFLLFGNGDLASLSWQVILVNSLKALPAIGLFLFSIAQYVKERNFQEEYAFKSAVALTVNAYAEQLKKIENRDKMIMESVGKIYMSPIHQKANQKGANTLSPTAKELIDTVKPVLPSK